MLRHAHWTVVCCFFQPGRDDVPGNTPVAEVIQGCEITGQVVGLIVGGGCSGHQPDGLGDGSQCRDVGYWLQARVSVVLQTAGSRIPDRHMVGNKHGIEFRRFRLLDKFDVKGQPEYFPRRRIGVAPREAVVPLRVKEKRLFDLLLREETKGARIRLETGVRERLLAQPWPGNVRQRRTCLRTLVALSLEGRVTLDDLAELLTATPAPTALAENPLGLSERQTLLTLIEAEHWHIAHVAARLGISRNTLYRKLRHHGISRRE